MSRSNFSLIFLLALTINLVLSLKCAPSACDDVVCPGVTECGPGEVLTKGRHCLCCDVCKKIVGENEYCGSGSPIGGVISDTVICDQDQGLICRKDKCQSVNNER